MKRKRESAEERREKVMKKLMTDPEISKTLLGSHLDLARAPERAALSARMRTEALRRAKEEGQLRNPGGRPRVLFEDLRGAAGGRTSNRRQSFEKPQKYELTLQAKNAMSEHMRVQRPNYQDERSFWRAMCERLGMSYDHLKEMYANRALLSLASKNEVPLCASGTLGMFSRLTAEMFGALGMDRC